MTVLWGASPMTVLWDTTPYDGYMGSPLYYSLRSLNYSVFSIQYSVFSIQYVYIDGTLCRSQLEDAVIEGVSGEVGGQSLWDRGGKAGAPPAALTAKGAVYVVYTYLHIEYGGEY